MDAFVIPDSAFHKLGTQSGEKRRRRLKSIMTTNIRPLHDRVIVKRIEEGEQVRGGIIIPDSAKEKPQEGEVIAAGLGKYSSSEIKLDGEELLIMREDEILGIISRAGAAASSAGSKSAVGSSGKKSGK